MSGIAPMRSEWWIGLGGGVALIEINEVFVLGAAILAWIVYRVFRWRQAGQVSMGRELLVNLFFVYLLFVFRLTFFPMYITLDGFSLNRANLDPFLTTRNMLRYIGPYTLTHILGNLLLLAPLGIFLPILAPWTRKWWRILGIGFLVTLGIEIFQFFLAVRVFDIDDLILNTFGVGFGYTLFVLASKIRFAITAHSTSEK